MGGRSSLLRGQAGSSGHIEKQTLQSPTQSLYLLPSTPSRAPSVSFLFELQCKSKNHKALMQISGANRCLGTRKLQGFIN